MDADSKPMTTTDGRVVVPRQSGDTNKKANSRSAPGAAAAPAAATGKKSAASGLTPLLLSRLRGIFDRVQSAEIAGEADAAVRKDKLRVATKEAHVITRTASALPPSQRSMVLELADNVKAVIATLQAMGAEEVKKSAAAWHERQKNRDAAAPEASAAAEQPAEPAAPAEPEKELTVDERCAAATKRLSTWMTVLASDEFTAGTIPVRRRTIALASHDVNTTMAQLEELDEAATIDVLLETIDKLTDVVIEAKHETQRLEQLKLPREAEEGGSKAAGAAAEEAEDEGEAGPSTYSLAALNEVLRDFHDALNAEHIAEIDPGLRSEALGAIAARLAEIERELLPQIDGSAEVKEQAASAVAALRARAAKLQAAVGGDAA